MTSQDKPRLMDFGIATLMGQKNDDTIWGTLIYMSPEQCNAQKITQSSNILSLGLVLFAMVTGKAAMHADNMFSNINKYIQ